MKAYMKKFILGLCVFALVLTCFAGCGSKRVSGTKFNIYYLSIDETCITPEQYTLDTTDLNKQQIAQKLIAMLENEPESSDLLRTISSNITCNSVSAADYLVTVDFPESYKELTTTEEVLIRAAVVKTLNQIPGIAYITFTIDGKPLMTADDTVVGKMSAEDFVENPEEAINTRLDVTLTLYFANEEGTGLRQVYRPVTYSSNTSVEKLVMKELINGTTASGCQSTIPSGTKIISISVMDGVCYVNLDETLQNDQNNALTEQVILYSIVDSLTDLPDVDKVQLAINGDTSIKLRYNCSLSELYEYNSELLVSGETDSTKSDSTESSLPAAGGGH